MGLRWRNCLRYRLSRPACLLVLMVGGALGLAQCAGRFTYSPGPADVYVFGWPLTHSAAVDRYGFEHRRPSVHMPPWSLHPRWYWSSQRFGVNALISVVLLVGTLCTAELHLRRWPRVQFALPQLLLWMALTGAMLSICMSEPAWVRWTEARVNDHSLGHPVPWVTLKWYIRLPVMFSVWCVLEALTQGAISLLGIAGRKGYPSLRLRLRFRFGLRTLLLATAIAGAVLAWGARHVREVQQQRTALALVQSRGGTFTYHRPVTYTSRGFIEDSRFFGRDHYSTPFHVSLTGTGTNDADLSCLCKLSGLEILYLDRTAVGDAGLDHVARLSLLNQLSLENTRITDAGAAHLPRLPRLTSLNLAYTQLTDDGLERLAGCSRLQFLALEGTRVTDVGLAHLRLLSALAVLNLSNTEVSDAGLAQLGELSDLRRLNVAGTRVTRAGIKHLCTAHPLLEVTL